MNPMLPWLAALAMFCCVALLAWVAHGIAREALVRWRAVFTETARLRAGEFFLFVDANQLWFAHLVGVAVLAAFGALFTRSWIAAALGAVVGALLPRWLAAALRRRRIARFDAQLPDALLTLASALRSGASLQSGLKQIVAEGQAPLSQEFALMLHQQRVGAGLDQSLAELHARMPTEAASLVSAALRIAADTGGNLAEALERIAATVRARLHMEGRIRALTAQGRLQARVVGALPALLAAALSWLEPAAMSQLWRTPMGWAVLAAVAALDLAGLWLIRRIVRIDV